MTLIKPFNKKLREREGLWEDLMSNLEKIRNTSPNSQVPSPRLWFHAASMGEFEQAKPIIEKIKINYPDCQIVVSFYSPSGYNNQKNYKYADCVLYMPFDKRSNAKYFIEQIKPDIAVFVRYEIWRNHLEILKQKNIPVYLICATIPNTKILFDYAVFRGYTKSNYNLFSKIFTVSDVHTQFFKELSISTNIITLSDTRFDRIIKNVEHGKHEKILPLELFSKNEFILIAGSTWEPDEEIIISAAKRIDKENIKNLKLIIVPHEPAEQHIKNLKVKLPNSFLLSQVDSFLSNENDTEVIRKFLGKNHIIVDSIGKLLRLYANADAAYIGGAFGTGVHSVTEPAGYGIPLSCGPKMENSPDALSLQIYNGLKVVKNEDDLFNWIKIMMTDKDMCNKTGKINRDYIYQSQGSSEKIVNEIIKEVNL